MLSAEDDSEADEQAEAEAEEQAAINALCIHEAFKLLRNGFLAS